MVERNKHEAEGDPKYIPYFFDPSDADQSPDTLRRWRREHLINVGTAETMEMRKWHLSQAVRCDLALISRGILPEIPKGIIPPTTSTTELVNESGLTEEQAQDLLGKYYEDSLKDQETLANPMSEPDDEVGMDTFGEVATERPFVEGRAFGATHLKIVSQPTPILTSKDKRIAYDCGCMYNETQKRWDFHCMLFRNSRCPNVEAQRAREEAQKQLVDGNSVTNCPECLKSSGVVRMDYQYATQWKCPVCGHWEAVTPYDKPATYAGEGVSVDDQPPCGCFWPYKHCDTCRSAYEAWWHRQVDAGLLNEVACPLETGRADRPLTQLQAQREAEQETQVPFAQTSPITESLMSVLEHERMQQARNGMTS